MLSKKSALIAVSLVSASLSFAAPVAGQGLGNCAAGWEQKLNGGPATYTSVNIINSVFVKAGSQNQEAACTEFTSNGDNGCYSVTGLGTNTVTVTKIGSGPTCKDISHAEFFALGGTPTPSTTPTATPEATPTVTPAPSATPSSTPEATPEVEQTSTGRQSSLGYDVSCGENQLDAYMDLIIDGQAVSGASVTFQYNGQTIVATTNENGRAVASFLRGEGGQLLASSVDFPSQSIDVVVPMDCPTEDSNDNTSTQIASSNTGSNNSSSNNSNSSSNSGTMSDSGNGTGGGSVLGASTESLGTSKLADTNSGVMELVSSIFQLGLTPSIMLIAGYASKK